MGVRTVARMDLAKWKQPPVQERITHNNLVAGRVCVAQGSDRTGCALSGAGSLSTSGGQSCSVLNMQHIMFSSFGMCCHDAGGTVAGYSAHYSHFMAAPPPPAARPEQTQWRPGLWSSIAGRHSEANAHVIEVGVT